MVLLYVGWKHPLVRTGLSAEGALVDGVSFQPNLSGGRGLAYMLLDKRVMC